jgi:hypothetical protein
MNKLLSGCAAVALCVGLAGTANAQAAAPLKSVDVPDAPVHTLIAAPEPPPAPAPTLVAALAPSPAADSGLTAEEAYFFTALGRHITDSASAYESYVRWAAGVDPAFKDATAVRGAVHAGAGFHPGQLQEGEIAYAALMALNNPDFVAGVRGEADPDFASHLLSQPQSVLMTPGARRAAAAATAALRAQGAVLTAQGEAISRAAYTLQAQPWSRMPVADPSAALAISKAAAHRPRTAETASKKLLVRSVMTAATTEAEATSVSPLVVRGLALAALAVRGGTGDAREASVAGLLHDDLAAMCMNLARMNLDQCLAAAGPHYEHVFCLGRHAVGETGKCVAQGAESGTAMETAYREPAPEHSGYGPEALSAFGYPSAPPAEDNAAPAARAPGAW